MFKCGEMEEESMKMKEHIMEMCDGKETCEIDSCHKDMMEDNDMMSKCGDRTLMEDISYG